MLSDLLIVRLLFQRGAFGAVRYGGRQPGASHARASDSVLLAVNPVRPAYFIAQSKHRSSCTALSSRSRSISRLITSSRNGWASPALRWRRRSSTPSRSPSSRPCLPSAPAATGSGMRLTLVIPGLESRRRRASNGHASPTLGPSAAGTITLLTYDHAGTNLTILSISIRDIDWLPLGLSPKTHLRLATRRFSNNFCRLRMRRLRQAISDSAASAWSSRSSNETNVLGSCRGRGSAGACHRGRA